jgi:aspartate/tyrosine/aromatic aminotransferase
MLIEGIQRDKDTFQAFRERNTDLITSSICNKVLSQYSVVIMILSTIYSSTDHILEILELLPDYIQSFSKVPYSRQLLMAMIKVNPSKITKQLGPQVEAIMDRFEELRHKK